MKIILPRARQVIPEFRWPETSARKRRANLLTWSILVPLISSCICVSNMVYNEYGRFCEGQTIIEGYTNHNNRFVNWVYDRRPNTQLKQLGADRLTGLGWDIRGKSYTLISATHVLSGHAEPPHSLTFWTGSSYEKRKIIKKQPLIPQESSATKAGGPAVLTLDRPLPAECRPYPIAVTINTSEYKGHELFVFSRHGRTGCQTVKVVDYSLYGTASDPLLLTDVDTMRVMYGDSNGAVLTTAKDGQLAVVGVIYSYISLEGQGNGGRGALLNGHHLVQAHLHQLRQIGVPFKIITIGTPSHLMSSVR